MRVTAHGLPMVIEPDSSRSVRVTIEPESLGALDAGLRFASDGAWFTAPDTVVRLAGTGVICGTIWADTARAPVGGRVPIGIHLDASPLTAADVARLMNESGARSIDFTLRGDPKLTRMAGLRAGDGMTGGLATAPEAATAGSSIRVRSGNASGNLAASDLVAVVMADALLGDRDRAPLTLAVESFADGNADLVVRDGLLLEEYCALDRRYVRANGPIISATATPLSKSGDLVIYLPEESRAAVTLHDQMGREVATLYDERASAGAYRISLAGHAVPSGIYMATLATETGTVTTRIVVVE
jgi:hypothetical protein